MQRPAYNPHVPTVTRNGAVRNTPRAFLGVICLIGLQACGAFSDTTGSSRHPQRAEASPEPVEKDHAGLVTKMPEIARAVSGSIPADLAKGKYWAYPFNTRTDEQYFAWEDFDSLHNRLLTVRVTRKGSIAQAKAKAAYVKDVLADDHVREGRQVVDTGPVKKIAHLADECLSFQISRENAARAIPGPYGADYSMGGRYLYCRVTNVNIVVDWEGFDYSRAGAPDTGIALDEISAEHDVERIAHAIITALH